MSHFNTILRRAVELCTVRAKLVPIYSGCTLLAHFVIARLAEYPEIAWVERPSVHNVAKLRSLVSTAERAWMLW